MQQRLSKQLFLLFLLFFSLTTFGQLKVMTWNIQHFGQTKTENELSYIAKIMNKADIVALQEVVTSIHGAKATASLLELLNRNTGAKWDYRLSDPTKSSPYRSERYVYFWKTSKVRVKGRAFLDDIYQADIEREPFFQTFIYGKKEVTLVNFHALPKKHQPETEIKYFKFYPEHYSNHNLVFLGDFNIPEKHTVFNPLKKMGYIPAFKDQKTTLRQKCIQADCLASAYDNIFISTAKIKVISTEAIHFYKDFKNVNEAKKISDHIPLLIEMEIL